MSAVRPVCFLNAMGDRHGTWSEKESENLWPDHFLAFDGEVCCVSNNVRHSLVESPSGLSPFFLCRNLSGHQRKREVVKHSSIVVSTSTHMTLLRMNQLLDTGRAAVETLYSNIVIAMCLRMVGSSCLYIYMCVCTILG